MKIKLKSILLAFIFVGCTPAEVLLVEELTEEAILVEKDLLGDPMEQQHPSPVQQAENP